MNRLNAIVRRFDNRMNPIVVKELRQTSRGKFLIVILLGFLFIQLAVTGAVSFFATVTTTPGPALFLSLFGFLTAASGLLIPAYAGFRLAQERADTNVDLLFSTSLKPASIVWGKTLSSAVLAALIYSVCMPFIVMTYLLRGIDLPAAFLLTAISFFAVMLATQGGILIGCMPANRVIKGIVGLFGLFMIFSLLMSWTIYVITELLSGSDVMTVLMSRRGLLTALGAFVLCVVLGIAFFLLSAAFISPASANRAFVPRIYATAVWLLTLAAVVVWGETASSPEPILQWMQAFEFIFGWGLWISVSERDRLGLRVRQKIPRSGALRVVSFLYYSGSAGGIVWASVGILLTFLFGSLAVFSISGTVSSLEFEKIAFSSFNMWIAGMGAFLIHRALLKNRISSGYTWLIAVMIYMASSLLWIMYMVSVGSAASIGAFSSPFTGLFTLFMRGVSSLSSEPPVNAAGVLALVLGCACLPWIARQIAAFKPYSRSTSAPQE